MKHSPCEALSFKCVFYVVMKVLMFIELVSGVKYPKITTVGFVLKRPFVDVSSLCALFFIFFVSGISCFHFERNLFRLFFQLHVNW